MTSREAFEAWKQEQSHALDRLGTYIGDPAEIWQAAIQHASDVAKDCIEHELGEKGQAKAIVHAIKEALK